MSKVTQVPAVAGQYYHVGKKVGEGSSSVVYEASNSINYQTVAIKFERKSDARQLRDEWRAYRTLTGLTGISQVYHFGTEGLYDILVLDLLGPSLEELFNMCNRRFTLKTVCIAARQMVTRVQTVHERNLINCDISPDNFLIGLPRSRTPNLIYMIDFGTARPWRDSATKQHIPYREGRPLTGTAQYISLNANLGREQSRRDDLESLGHVLLYFLRGGLPWQGLEAATNKQKYEVIGEKKKATSLAELCAGLPNEMTTYMEYVRGLRFEDTPDYNYLRQLFTEMMRNARELDDGMMDWMLLNGGKGWESSAARKQLPAPSQDGGGDHNDQYGRQQISAMPAVPPQSQSSQTPLGTDPSFRGTESELLSEKDTVPNDQVQEKSSIGTSPSQTLTGNSSSVLSWASGKYNRLRKSIRSSVDRTTGGLAGEQAEKEVHKQAPTPPRDAVIGSSMTSAEIATVLACHGCADLTQQLETESCSAFAVSNGGFGDVFTGKLRDGTRVAIKAARIQALHGHSGKELKHAARELHTWSKCDHPNVLRLLGLVEFRGQVGMVSQWIENGSIWVYLSRHPDTDRRQLCYGICDGLAYLHSNGIIHGDLKGANVLVSDNGIPLLADFGNSVLNSQSLKFSATIEKSVVSPRWTAPEVLEGEVSSSYSADIFSLGMTLLETITGEVPYSQLSDRAVFWAISMTKQIPTRPEKHIPNNKRDDMLWSLFEECWNFEPERRPNAQQVREKMLEIVKMASPLDMPTPTSS